MYSNRFAPNSAGASNIPHSAVGQRTAPIDDGERLVTLPRGDSEEIRVSWASFKGRPFLNVRLWTRGTDGQWWPDAKRGIAIRVHELEVFADGISAALTRNTRAESDR